MFVLSVGYCSASLIRDGMKYQIGVDLVLILTLLFLAVGIGIQFVFSGIRIDFLCISIANMLFYIRYYKNTLQVDAVTRLLNRRCYDVDITDIGSRAVIAFFDVDKFKQVNDTFGHSRGDVCLRTVAQLLRGAYGKNGVCYRIVGDEFCVIVQNHLEKMEEMNRSFFGELENLQREDATMPGGSMGFALYDAASSRIQNVIEEADAMLYRNKNG